MPTYSYEALNADLFQQLAQALIVAAEPSAQVFPVGEPDGGRDATARRQRIVFQVKFTRNPERVRNVEQWVQATVRDEVEKIQHLRGTRKPAKYILVTNIRGTGASGRGTIDRGQEELQRLTRVDSAIWWRDDLDRRLDGQKEIKWAYPTILSAVDGMRLLLEEAISEHRARRISAIRAFMAKQYADDQDVRFRQVELQSDLMSLFIDVPATFILNSNDDAELLGRTFYQLAQQEDKEAQDPAGGTSRRLYYHGADYAGLYYHGADYATGGGQLSIYRRGRDGTVESTGVGAASLFLSREAGKAYRHAVLEGAPGQGKSTLGQYICQVHRMRLLDHQGELAKLPGGHRESQIRLPVKVELRDLASWLNGISPWPGSDPSGGEPSLETFLAAVINRESGGVEFTVYDLHAVLATMPTLLVLDALDEVADLDDRQRAVAAINEGVGRLDAISIDLQVLVTSRPSAYPRSIGPSRRRFTYAQLLPVTNDHVAEYTEKWIIANKVRDKEAVDARRTLSQRLREPHVRELARNPMQLAILLALVRRHSASLPDKRTDFYTKYVDLFFDRESEKHDHVRDNRELLIDLHRYLAWVLHAGAESGSRQFPSGRISRADLEDLISEYLETERRSREVAELVNDMTLRIVAIVSRVEGTFEFEVQPLREYFAGRFLYETAPLGRPGEPRVASVPDRFAAIAPNLYWRNVARFMAGFYRKGELDSLVGELERLVASDSFLKTEARRLGINLLADWSLSQSVRATRDAARIVCDDLTIRTILADDGIAISEPAAQESVGDIVLHRLEGSLQLPARAGTYLRSAARNVCSPNRIRTWWSEHVEAAASESELWTMVELGVELGVLEGIDGAMAEGVLRVVPRGPQRRWMAVASGHTGWIEESEEELEQVLREIASGAIGVGPYAPTSTDGAVTAIGQLLRVNVWGPGFISTMGGVVQRGTSKLASRLAAVHTLISNDLSGQVRSYYSRSLLSHDSLIGLHELVGDGVALVHLANSFVRYHEIEVEPHDGDLGDSSASWAERVAAARAYSGRSAWWYTQASRVLDDGTWCYLVFAVASPAVIERMASSVTSRLANLSDREFIALEGACRQAVERSYGSGPTAERLVRLVRTAGNERFGRLVCLRLDYERAELEFAADNEVSASVRRDFELTALTREVVAAGNHRSSGVIRKIRALHNQGAQVRPSFGASDERRMRLGDARFVCSHALEMPSELLDVAVATMDEQTPTLDLTILEISRRDQWFT